MKITKEEKSLYNFLNIFYAIFGKSEYRNTIVGRGNKCYFFTNSYIGVFEDKDRDTLTGGNYDFGKCFYELKQMPNKTFILDEVKYEDNVFDESIEKSILFADELAKCNNFCLEYEKNYDFKLAKIAEETGRWLKDTDIKHLDKFKRAEVFQLEDSIIVKSFGLTDEDCSNVTTTLVFVGEIHPDLEDSTQQKMDVEEPTVQMLEGNEMKVIETSHDAIILDDITDDDVYPPEMEDESFDDEQESGNGVYF
ncbi:MAG: hypothetical protein ACLUVC_02335 [Longibaculum sp.]